MGEEVFSHGGLRALQGVIDHHVGEGTVPGVVGLVDCGGETHVFVGGTKALGGVDPMTPDTIFRIASMTKPITAVATMMLVDEGRLQLDDPVDDLLPELAHRHVLRSLESALDDVVPAERRITVEDLLTFRWGMGLPLAPPDRYPIQRAIAERGLAGFGPPDPAAPYGPDGYMRRLGELPLMAQPGAEWFYTAGSNVLGVLVARAADQPFSAFLADRVFAPLGMRDSGFFVASEEIERFVPAYVAQGQRLALHDDARTGGWSRPPAFEAGDAGLVATVGDFLAFSRLLLNGGRHGEERLLSSDAVAAMQVDRLNEDQRSRGRPILAPGTGWGYGMSVVIDPQAAERPMGCIGWAGGFGTSWIADPASGLSVILMTQRLFSDPVLPVIHKAFQDAAFAAVGSGSTR
ncbi:serine hydrolase domain-containing protein [Flavisphingomonas formosensis]|uniref:serine hydrolase domain-containing protein n=1 Tax=Flavisphingomonas formosensis TaxID=861534 RepID=UPI0012F8D76D|nr:serine hydrolase domain-containing protein [Sphingomonas formosensis]